MDVGADRLFEGVRTPGIRGGQFMRMRLSHIPPLTLELFFFFRDVSYETIPHRQISLWRESQGFFFF